MLHYQWQLSTDGGASFSDISGEVNASLTLVGVTFAQNGNQYRVITSDPSYICADTTSLAASLIIVADSDNDGISNEVDLDDDNDGILDIVECPNTILWVTQGAPGTEEQNVIDRLTALGYIITVVDDGVGGDANNFAVTFIYEDVNSNTAFANVANLTTTENGVITSENALHDELIGASTGGTSVTNIVNITNITHPITAS